MEIKNVEAYVQLLNQNGLSELKLKTEEFELQIKKEGTVSSGVLSQSTPAVQAVPRGEVQKAEAITDVVSGNDVKSPIVGVVYLTPEPGKPPYVHVGDHVKKGQKLAIISAMKVMNDFISPVDGVIKEICVSNEEVVEFDQTLFIIG